MKAYDYLIVGAGLFGAVFAHEAAERGKTCLVIDKRDHIAGNAYTEVQEGIVVHKYGAHIFHTSNKKIWDYVQQFAEFNRYTNSPIANYKGEIYNMPFNMNTFYKMWGTVTPAQAQEIIAKQRQEITGTVQNLEEQAISLVGRDLYEKLVKGYTQKQWGCPCSELPSFIIKRLPVRFTYDNNYFNDLYQGVPIGGYTEMVRNMLQHPNIHIKLQSDYIENRREYDELADRVVYTGMIDEYYDSCYGRLEYRSLMFETEVLDIDNYQGNAVVNYTDYNVPYTRVIEHKHFEYGTQPKTIITKEYPKMWEENSEPYYPINNKQNNELYERYRKMAQKEKKVIFGGRLAQYKYYDMHQVIEEALRCAYEVC